MSKRESIFGFEPIVVGEGVLPHGRELMAISRRDVRRMRRYALAGDESISPLNMTTLTVILWHDNHHISTPVCSVMLVVS
jgi:hypothetical protein